jgi:hypothetical protein
MTFGERGSSFNLWLRGVFARYINCGLHDKRPLVDNFMASGRYEKSDVRFLEVSFIRRILI